MAISRRQLAKAYVKLSDKFSAKDLITAFARLLMQARRGREVELFVQDVARAWQEATGEVVGDVFSARPLSRKALASITSYIEEMSGATKVRLITKEDAGVVGGAQVQTWDRDYDFSARRFLRELY